MQIDQSTQFVDRLMDLKASEYGPMEKKLA